MPVGKERFFPSQLTISVLARCLGGISQSRRVHTPWVRELSQVEVMGLTARSSEEWSDSVLFGGSPVPHADGGF